MRIGTRERERERPGEARAVMSWLRAAVIRAVEAGAGGKDNITRTVRNVAGTVVYHAGNAVVEGAKIIQDRIVISFSLFLSILNASDAVWFCQLLSL